MSFMAPSSRVTDHRLPVMREAGDAGADGTIPRHRLIHYIREKDQALGGRSAAGCTKIM